MFTELWKESNINPRIKLALLNTDRGLYTSESAYEDRPQPIGYSATISAPSIHLLALQHLSPKIYDGACILDIGSGSGYVVSAIARLVRPSGRVYGIDCNENLVNLAYNNIMSDNPLLLNNIELYVGDGWSGLPEKGPFDAIHIGAAIDHIPLNLINQLKSDGILLAPVGNSVQEYVQYNKATNTQENLGGVRFIPLVHLH